MKPNAIVKNLIIIALYAFAALFTVLAVSELSIVSVVLAVVGFFLIWILSSFIHESFHFIFAKASGFKVVSFSFFIFRYDDTKQRKVSFGLTPYLGETGIIPIKNCDFIAKYRFIVLGGIIGSFLAATVFSLLYALLPSPVGFLFCAFPFSIAILLINAVPTLVETSDASVLFSMRFDEEREAMNGFLCVVYQLSQGKTYAEIDPKFFTVEGDRVPQNESYYLMNFKRALEIGDEDKAAEYAAALNRRGDISIDSAIELFCYYIYIGDEEHINKYRYVLPSSYDMDEPCKARAMLMNSRISGDDAYYKVLYPTAVKLCKNAYLEGEGGYNLKMIEKMENGDAKF